MIAARYGIPITSPGAILREEKRRGSPLGLEAEKVTSQGRLLPDPIIVGLVRAWLEHHAAEFVFDGFPRSRGQADALDELLDERHAALDVVLALEASPETLRQRVAGRMVCKNCGQIVGAGLHVKNVDSPCPKCGGPLGRRSDDTPEILAARLEEYAAKTEPLLEYYEQRGLLRRVDSARSPELVFASIAAILEGA
jgi:adenylate kinase